MCIRVTHPLEGKVGEFADNYFVEGDEEEEDFDYDEEEDEDDDEDDEDLK